MSQNSISSVIFCLKHFFTKQYFYRRIADLKHWYFKKQFSSFLVSPMHLYICIFDLVFLHFWELQKTKITLEYDAEHTSITVLSFFLIINF